MKSVKVLDGQTLVDIAVQELGDAERVMEIAEANEMKVTDDLVSGSEIMVPDFDRTKRSIVNLFSDDANKPASALTVDETEGVGEGIGFWIIENDFVVQ